jgi:mRNA interferase RelE/StbE
VAWTIRIHKEAAKELKRLDTQVAKRVSAFFRRVDVLENPRCVGGPLQGNLAGIWRYKIGQIRILCVLQDDVLIVTAVSIGLRQENTYKNNEKIVNIAEKIKSR